MFLVLRDDDEVAAWLWIGKSGFDSQPNLTACGPSDDKVIEVFGRPGARVFVGLARERPLAAYSMGAGGGSKFGNWTTVP